MFGWLFGGSNSADKVVNTGCGLLESAASGIDKIFFTDEERSDASQATFKLWLEGQTVLRDENSIRSITRRILAVAFCSVYMFLLLVGIVLYRFDPEWGKLCFEIAQILTNVVLTVVFFYFGPNMIGRAISQAKKK